MAAFAALVSLLNTVNQIHTHPRLSKSFLQKEIDHLTQKLDSLIAFVEKYASDADLESQIASAAQVAEDTIEFHIVDQIVASSPSLLDLQQVIQEMDAIEEKAMEVKAEGGLKTLQLTDSTSAAPSTSTTAGKITMVGFDGYRDQLMDQLTSEESERRIIPITGMGGIGKTTLARNIYESLLIKASFPLRAWVTVSQEYSSKKILFDILSCLGETSRDINEKSESELSDKLYKKLMVGKYLIIIDDMWSINAWDEIKFYLPDSYNKSRIIVTTRQMEVVKLFTSSPLQLHTLEEDKSWELFCNKAFGEGELCPQELETIGKEIVRKCKGLPLSLAVIGGLLGKSSKTPEYWEGVAKDISSALDSVGDNQYDSLLSVSYNYLPAYLKPCFLYLGIYPEDHEFRVTRLVKLWIAEGLLKPSKNDTLEDIARSFITDLVDRNLVIVSSVGSNGKLRTCKIHDLLRDICLGVVKKEKFLFVERVVDLARDVNMERRIINHGRIERGAAHSLESTSLARSLIFQTPAQMSFKSKLLRLLIEVYSDSIDAAFQQANLRLLAYESVRSPIDWIRSYELPPSISLLWNVQTLIIDRNVDKVVAPSEIWMMRHLRHLIFKRVQLPDPPIEEDRIVLQNLQTVKTAEDFKCSDEVCKRMPNVRKLKIFYEDFAGEVLESSSCSRYSDFKFDKLESLSCIFYTTPNRDDLLQNLKFPNSLKKLILQYCEIPWDEMSIIGSLPNLEVLKLKYQSARGPEWNPVEGEFVRLKFLEIDSCYLIIWGDTDSSHFPALEKLVLIGLYKLDQIPSGMADLTTLKSLSVLECSVSSAISAIRILDEKIDNDDNDLQVRIGFRQKPELEEFKGKVEQYGLASHIFQINQV